jgi:hypothetical protein
MVGVDADEPTFPGAEHPVFGNRRFPGARRIVAVRVATRAARVFGETFGNRRVAQEVIGARRTRQVAVAVLRESRSVHAAQTRDEEPVHERLA